MVTKCAVCTALGYYTMHLSLLQNERINEPRNEKYKDKRFTEDLICIINLFLFSVFFIPPLSESFK